MTVKCPSCGFPLSILREAGGTSKRVCRRCGRQEQPQRDARPICPKCGLAALHVLSLPDHPGKLLFVHHAGEAKASGCLVDETGFRTLRA
jgi:hypothetical protein